MGMLILINFVRDQGKGCSREAAAFLLASVFLAHGSFGTQLLSSNALLYVQAMLIETSFGFMSFLFTPNFFMMNSLISVITSSLNITLAFSRIGSRKLFTRSSGLNN